MEIKTVYQTLEDRDNPNWVEDNGPLRCDWPNTWLGSGYYFWDTFIENAHWWGEVRINGDYMICEAQFDFDTSTCFDLVGHTSHMDDFFNSIELMKSKKLVDRKTTVARVIEFMRSINAFDYNAMRACGIKSKSKKSNQYVLNFEVGKPQFLDYRPAIQICFYNFNDLNFKNFRVVYPDEYNSEYAV